jgi:hypothetical protein
MSRRAKQGRALLWHGASPPNRNRLLPISTLNGPGGACAHAQGRGKGQGGRPPTLAEQTGEGDNRAKRIANPLVTAQVPLFLSFKEASIRLGRRLSREQM